jgi:hypothetical protein
VDTKDLEEKLTDAARDALKDVVRDYRAQLLISAADNASRMTGELREISVHDLYKAIQATSSELRTRPSRPIEYFLNLYIVMGILLGLAGLGWFAARDAVLTLTTERQLPLLIGLSGFGIAAVSFMVLRLQQLRVLRIQSIDFLRPGVTGSFRAQVGFFISKWQEIELLLRTKVGSNLGESVAKAPFSALLELLRRDGMLSEEDSNQLRRLLELRNSVVHGQKEITQDELRSSLRYADQLLEKLRSRGISAAH